MRKNSSLSRLAVVVSLAAVLLSSCSALKGIGQTRAVRSVSDKIAGYAIPEDYTAQFGVEMLGYQMVGLEGPDPSCHIYLVQAPKEIEIDMAGLQAQARSLDGKSQSGDPGEMQAVETRTAVIRGEEVPVLVSEGINHEEKPYRQVTSLFEGRGGPALVSISSPVDAWNWDLVDRFLASIE